MTKHDDKSFDRIVYLLQGGGALGAYQVGVIKHLLEKNYLPDWIIGTSIGAINSAIIAGNHPNDRILKMEQFWKKIATNMPDPPDTLNNIFFERLQHFLSAQISQTFGQPGFYRPRIFNPWLSFDSTTDKLSYYDTSDLRDTLCQFINFDLLNEKKVRLSIAAVHIATGQLTYFDNTKMEITPDHVMASGALPPGFPAITINDRMYWDGGVHSNTQVNLLFRDNLPIRSLCFMVHLFDSYGTRPTRMDDVYKRQKDISYSSRHREAIEIYRYVHNLRRAIHTLSQYLPDDKKNNSEIKKLIEYGQEGVIHLVRFHYKGKLSDLSSKDFEFSLPSVREHINNGYHDAVKHLLDPPWYKPHSEDEGVIIHELSEEFFYDDNLFEK